MKKTTQKQQRLPVELKRTALLGDLIHDKIDEICDEVYSFGEKKRRLQVSQLMFRGTCDRLQYFDSLGGVLTEYKTIESYERDKQGANKFMSKILKLNTEAIESLKVPLHLSHKASAMLFTESELQEIESRLHTRPKILLHPKSDHITQASTYAWILEYYFNLPVNYLCVCYITREKLQTKEFWYDRENVKVLQTAAYNNYMEVFKCLQSMTG